MTTQWWMAGALALVSLGCSFEVPDPFGADSGGTGGNGGSGAVGGMSTASSPTGMSTTTSSSTGGCVAPEAECPGEMGCFDIKDDASHCGAACVSCVENAECFNGTCGCPGGTLECNNPPGCFDPKTDEAHCGSCTSFCLSGEICSEGLCCPTGESRCGMPADGCYNLLIDEAHCGSCTKECAGDEFCQAGTCACNSGKHSCPNLTGCFNDDDTAHCGPACTACPTGATCTGDQCVCPGGLIPCAGACVDPASTTAHCGACNHDCNDALFPGATCSFGQCQPSKAAVSAQGDSLGLVRTLAADLTASPTVLYAISPDSQLWRFGNGVVAAREGILLNGGFPMTVSAGNGEVAYGYTALSNGSLHVGMFGGISPAFPSNSGFSLVQYLNGQLFWADHNCIRRNILVPVELGCFPGEFPSGLVPDPQNSGRALLHTPTASAIGAVRLLDLGSGAVLATYPPSAPYPYKLDDEKSSFAIDSSGTSLYYFPTGTVDDFHLERYDIATGTRQALYAFTPDAAGVAVIRDGGTLYFATRHPATSTIEMRRATIASLNAISGNALSASMLPPIWTLPGSSAWDFHQDSSALYFVADFQVFRQRK